MPAAVAGSYPEAQVASRPMMAALFLGWFAAFVVAWTGRRIASVIIALVTLIFCMAMLRYHMSDDITISL